MHLAYVNVFVRDLERAIVFYRDVLGLRLEHAAREHGYASFDAGPVRLGLAVAGETQGALVGRHTGVGLAVDDLVAEHARLVARGARFGSPPEKQPWGGFMALLEDPDGNVFYLDQIAAVHG